MSRNRTPQPEPQENRLDDLPLFNTEPPATARPDVSQRIAAGAGSQPHTAYTTAASYATRPS
ncbi:hypothetical protein, partial [Kribbia dieselivorans]|uniref:hypothetical protein n=1 Tax=Kribbia dieselivorans TaxID=331526 RepID=UPI0012ECCF78